MSESFFDTPFLVDELNNQKPENYPQKFHYYSAKTMSQEAKNVAAMKVPVASVEDMVLMNHVKK